MISKNSNLLKLIAIILIIIIFLALFILFFCWVCYLLPIDFPGTISDWIGGLSSLAGGALTLGGVWWTIKDNNNQKKIELRTHYMPLINTSENLIRFDNFSNFQDFTIVNEGRGEFYVDKIISSNVNIIFIKCFNPLNILQKNQRLVFTVYCNITNSFPDKIKQNEIIKITVIGRNLLNEKVIAEFLYNVNYISNVKNDEIISLNLVLNNVFNRYENEDSLRLSFKK